MQSMQADLQQGPRASLVVTPLSFGIFWAWDPWNQSGTEGIKDGCGGVETLESC